MIRIVHGGSIFLDTQARFRYISPPRKRVLITERERFGKRLRFHKALNTVEQRYSVGHRIFASIRVSPSEYDRHYAMLITTADITKRL